MTYEEIKEYAAKYGVDISIEINEPTHAAYMIKNAEHHMTYQYCCCPPYVDYPYTGRYENYAVKRSCDTLFYYVKGFIYNFITKEVEI